MNKKKKIYDEKNKEKIRIDILKKKENKNFIKSVENVLIALNHLKERIPSDHINNVIFHLVEASTFGNNIEVSLNNQLDFLRNKQLMEIKGEIGKLPTKVSIISVVFFIPIILLVILAPVIVNFISK